MGSSPSYQSQQNLQGLSVNKSRNFYHHNKPSKRSVKQPSKQGEAQEINPEHREGLHNQGENGQIQKPFQSFQPENEDPEGVNLKTKHSNGSRRNTPQPNYQEIAKSNIPKKILPKEDAEQQVKQQGEQEDLPQQQKIREKQRYHYPIKGREHRSTNHTLNEDQQTPRAIQHQNRRNYIKADVQNPTTIKKSNRKSEEFDYHQYDSAHIRHKAIQQIHQQQHPIHPIKHKEPIYQHQKLYPKIVKNFHKDKDIHTNDDHRNKSNNRHIQHEFNVDDEYYQQPHKPHLYKRLRIPMTNRQHEQEQQEQQQPIPKRVIRNQHNLQKSMEVWGENRQQIHDLKKSLNVKLKNENPKQRRGSINQDEEQLQNEPAKNANFRKRKPQSNIIEAKRQLQQFEQKSIAELNKQNQFNVTEFNVDPLELVTCRQGCGRKFQVDRIQKHELICRKVFQQKRKAFNAQQQRIVSKQQKKLQKKGMPQLGNKKQQRKISKWKAQSIALRAHIKMGMDEKYTPNQQQMQMLSQEQHIDVVNCEYCGRNFNKNSAKTHIPFCKGKYEKEMERERFQRPVKDRR